MAVGTLTKHYFISGRVQGVGFRAFTRRIAEEAQLSGWVRNLPDGRVEALVRGGPNEVQLFEARLRKGPHNGEVKKIEVSEGDSESIPDVFEIRKDGR
jgi:acylphosphatase